MALETFDQRFKRLTSDMLMIDLCQILSIEVRDLMKIRSGVRVELPMNGIRRLCNEQGLDFNSFIRGYNEPWSIEIRTNGGTVAAPDIAEDHEPVTAGSAKAPKAKFRPDGSREIETPPQKKWIETVSVSEPPRAARSKEVPVIHESLQRAGTLVGEFSHTPEAPPVRNQHEYKHEDADQIARPGFADRLRAMVTTAVSAAFGPPDVLPELDDDFLDLKPISRSNTVPELPKADSVSLAKYETAPIGNNDKSTQLATILSEVSVLRREVSALSSNVERLLRR